MNLESQEIMSALTTPEGEIVFRKVYDATDFAHVGSENAAEAYNIVSNLVIGLNENKEKLSLASLHVVKNALFTKFSDLGVPSGLIQPLLGCFAALDRCIVAQSRVEAEKKPQ